MEFRLTSLFTLTFITFFLITEVKPAKILAVFVLATKSHKLAFDPLLVELANRGHELTVVTQFKGTTKPNKNLREITGPTYKEIFQEEMANPIVMRLKGEDLDIFNMLDMFSKTCEVYYTLPQFESLLNETFDLVVMDPFMQECFYGLIDHFGAPAIFLESFPTPFWTTSSFGTPTLPSITPFTLLPYTDRMNFWERTRNLFSTIFNHFVFTYAVIPKLEAIYQKRFPEARPVSEIQKSISILMENSHASFLSKRPITPDVIQTAGMHCRKPKALPKDLQSWADSAGEDGFIFFSLGSFAQGSAMPEHVRKIFVNTFAKLKQKVLWKWETESMEGISANLKLSKWLPQQDVLGHRNCKLFITHGGLLSMEEAIYNGIPLLGFPLFGEQDSNLNQAEQRGFATSLEFSTLTEEKLLETIKMLLNDPKYMEAAKTVAKVFQDEIVNPVDKAVFWTEYVLRHKGAAHLKSSGRDLNFVQFYSLDSFAVLIFGILSAIYAVYFVSKMLLSWLGNTLGINRVSKTKKID